MMKLTKNRRICIRAAWLLVFAVALTTCEFRTGIANRHALKIAEQLLDENPDSALRVLNTVQTGLLDQLHHARYQVLRVRAKDKMDMDVTSDTAVFLARNYLVEKMDRYAAMACFVTANIYGYQEKTSLAITDYMKVDDLLAESDDYVLRSAVCYNLARIYYLQRLHAESLTYLKKAQLFDNLAGTDDKYKIYTLEYTALNYIFTHETDSALYYLNKALNLDITNYDEGRIYVNVALALRDAAQYAEAKRKCFQAMSLVDTTDLLVKGRLYLTLATIYNKTKYSDSAYIIAYQAKDLLDNRGNLIDLTDLYKLLSELEMKNRNMEKYAVYQEKYEGYLSLRKRTDDKIKEEQEKQRDNYISYMQDERNRLLIRNLRQRNIIIFLCSVLIIIPGGYLFWRYRKKKSRELKKERKRRKKLERERQQYTETIESIRKMMNDERMKVFFRIGDLVELKNISYVKQNEKELRIQIKKILNYYRWDDVYPVINDMHNGLFDRIRADFPDLSAKEYQTCCLIVMGFGLVIVSVILDEDSRTAQNRQTQIRKELGIGPRGDIRAFFASRYGITEPDEQDNNDH